MTWCVECLVDPGKRIKATEEDPRIPPVAEGECFCEDCALAALSEEEDRLETELEDVRVEIKRLGGKTNE